MKRVVLGGVVDARTLANRDLMLARTTFTFHGRDIFAPIAARIATGTPFADVGPPIDIATLVALDFPAPSRHDGGLETTVLFIDSFGNIRLAGVPMDLESAIGPLAAGRPLSVDFPAHDGHPGLREDMPWCRTFGERPAGAPLLYENSFGGLAIADNQGNAAARLGIESGRPVRIRPARGIP